MTEWYEPDLTDLQAIEADSLLERLDNLTADAASLCSLIGEVDDPYELARLGLAAVGARRYVNLLVETAERSLLELMAVEGLDAIGLAVDGFVERDGDRLVWPEDPLAGAA